MKNEKIEHVGIKGKAMMPLWELKDGRTLVLEKPKIDLRIVYLLFGMLALLDIMSLIYKLNK